MNMLSLKSRLVFFGLLFVVAISNFNFALAQDTTGIDGIILPTANVDDNTNIYLQNNSAPVTNTAPQSGAQIANGKLSGVYEGTILSCPYAFERDLTVGSSGEDVRLLQVLLNSDRRTLIAVSGPGSLGKETTSFGTATKVAVKKFQALFIEYIGVANGRFGPRTRTTMNAICNGQTTPTQNSTTNTNKNIFNNVQSIQANATPVGEITEIPNDKIAPNVSLSANLNTVNSGADFKIIANFSEEIKPFTPDSIIIDGGVVKEIRKLSKVSYAMVVTANTDAKSVTAQIEADRISDLANNLNENASNEVNVKVNPAANTAINSTDNVDINSILAKIVGSAPTSTTSGAPASYDQTRNCYGDTGTLPSGVSETARCNNPSNPNAPGNQVVCSTSFNSYSGSYQQQCQTQNQANQQQQAQQNSQLGQLLGSLLGKGLGGMGQQGMQGQQNGLNGLNGNPGPAAYGPAAQVPPAKDATTPEKNPDGTPKALPLDDAQRQYDTAQAKSEAAQTKYEQTCGAEGSKERESAECGVAAAEAFQAKKDEAEAAKKLEASIAEEAKPENQKPENQKFAECMADPKNNLNTSGECKQFDSSNDPAKTNSSSGDKIIKKLDKCSINYPGYSSTKQTSNFTGTKADTIDANKIFLVAKGTEQYLLIVPNDYYSETLKPGTCLLQEPAKAKDRYISQDDTFNQCVNANNTTLARVVSQTTGPSQYTEVKRGLKYFTYKYDGETLQAGACK